MIVLWLAMALFSAEENAGAKSCTARRAAPRSGRQAGGKPARQPGPPQEEGRGVRGAPAGGCGRRQLVAFVTRPSGRLGGLLRRPPGPARAVSAWTSPGRQRSAAACWKQACTAKLARTRTCRSTRSSVTTGGYRSSSTRAPRSCDEAPSLISSAGCRYSSSALRRTRAVDCSTCPD